MAIQPGGDGSQANPYVIDNSDGLAWDDFNTLNTNYYDKYITFADVHIDENNDFDISGTGTSADPYIVSTYREMLHCTGASNIHKCKMIAKDSTTREMTYRYDLEDPETHVVSSIYCRYNPAPTTIDYNDVSEEYQGSINIKNHCDLNGWTLLNFKVSFSGNGEYSGIFSTRGTQEEVYNAFVLNMQAKVNSDVTYPNLFNVNIHDSIMHIEVDASVLSSSKILGMAYGSSAGHGFSRNSLVLTVIGDCAFGGYCIGNGYSIVDSLIDMDFEGRYYGVSSTSSGTINLTRTTFKGKYKFTSAQTRSFIGSCTDSIYDVESVSEATTPAPVSSGIRCIFNNEKVSWSQTGWEGVSSEYLLSPSWLHEHTNFPIGVDT